MNNPPTIGQLTGVIQSLIQGAIYLAGAGVILMLLAGGIQYLMAGGDKEAAQKASRTITFAILGLVLVLSSWMIILLIGNFLGIDLKDFVFDVCLPGESC